MRDGELLVGLRDMVLGIKKPNSLFFIADTEEEFQDLMNELYSISPRITGNWCKDSGSLWRRFDSISENHVEKIFLEYDPSYGRVFWGGREDITDDMDLIYIRELYAESQCDICVSQYDIDFLL